ncbi:MAG TPA: hypothetical protein VFM27_12380 [Acidimicrobiales bacterium]|nr:hypothetical protein [Acidimicrobiales bacterium]
MTERLRTLPDGRWLAASREDVAAVLDHGDASARPPGTAGLRAAMARFSHGEDHRRRRAVAEERLAAVEPPALRARARDLAAAALAAAGRIDHVVAPAHLLPPVAPAPTATPHPAPPHPAPRAAPAAPAETPTHRIDLTTAPTHRIDLTTAPTPRIDLTAAVARPVPLAALAEALGASDGPAAAGAARRLARALAPPRGAAAGEPETPAAELARLLGLPADPLDEVVANTVALCFQAVDATAGLIGLAVLSGRDDPDAAVAAALAAGGPVLRTYRWATRDLDLPTGTVPAGDAIVVALPTGDAPFGAGPHRCPGAGLAVALACGVVEAVLASGLRLAAGPPAFEPRDNLRIPAALVLSP